MDGEAYAAEYEHTKKKLLYEVQCNETRSTGNTHNISRHRSPFQVRFVPVRSSSKYKGALRPAHLKGSWVGWQEDSGSQDSSEVGLNCAQKAEVNCAH